MHIFCWTQMNLKHKVPTTKIQYLQFNVEAPTYTRIQIAKTLLNKKKKIAWIFFSELSTRCAVHKIVALEANYRSRLNTMNRMQILHSEWVLDHLSRKKKCESHSQNQIYIKFESNSQIHTNKNNAYCCCNCCCTLNSFT